MAKNIKQIEVTFKINFPNSIAPITHKQAKEFIEQMDYDIKDRTGKFSDRSDGTMEAEIVADDLDDFLDNPIDAANRYDPLS